MNFVYTGYDAKGAGSSGAIEAQDEGDAINKLR